MPEDDVLPMAPNPATNASAVIEGNIELIRDMTEALTKQSADNKKKRAKFTSQKNKARKEIYALGISRQALDLALRISELSEEDRQEADKGLVMIRRAIGLPMQGDLFE